jgi:hypothetical protein
MEMREGHIDVIGGDIWGMGIALKVNGCNFV